MIPARAGAAAPHHLPRPQHGLLTTAAAIRALPPIQAARHLPARITGVITFYDRVARRHGRQSALYVQDRTGGIFVDLDQMHPDLRAGERVLVRGQSGAGGAAPILVAAQIQVLGVAPLPPPRVLDLRQAATGLADAQRIAVEGVVQSERFTPRGLILRLKADLATMNVRLPVTPAVHPPHWVDAGVRVTGVLATIFIGNTRSGVAIFAPGLKAIQLIQPAPQHPFRGPRHAIADLLRFTPWGVFPHRVRIQGVVTAATSSGCQVQDATGGAWVQWASSRPLPPAPPLGAVITVIGFPTLRGGAVRLEEARMRRLSLGPPPPAMPLPAVSRTPSPLDGRLGYTVARLHNISVRSIAGVARRITLYLSGTSGPLEAVLSGPGAPRLAARGLLPGSLLRLTGIALPAPPSVSAESGTGIEWTLSLRDSADVVLLQRPAWWSGEKLRWVLLAVIVLVLLALAWIWLLRRSLRLQAAALTRSGAERAELERQLQQAQRLEALGRLAGGIAHDFNNLLTIVSGRSGMLLAGRCEEPQRPALEAIQSAAERAAGLTRQLLAYSRRQALAPAPLDLNAVISEFVPMLRALIGESIALELDLAPGLPPIFADRGPLEQVVMNLAINARDAMPGGGHLRLRTSLASRADAATPAPSSPGPYAELEVSDTGAGMTNEVRQRIFEPFFTTKEPGQGTGLGLALVYGIVQETGGQITVRSAPGQGTAFTVFFPLASSALGRARASAAAT